MTPEQLFDRTIPEPNTGCWLWAGSVDRGGYGVVKTRPQIYAHRLSYQLHCGEILPGQSVLHSCDQRSCANPGHLRTGNAKDNAKDRELRGRNKNTKLTVEQVRAIRVDSRGRTAIGREYGITSRHVYDIQTGRTWHYFA